MSDREAAEALFAAIERERQAQADLAIARIEAAVRLRELTTERD